MTVAAEGPGGEDVDDVTIDADGIGMRNSFTGDGSSVLKIIVVCILKQLGVTVQKVAQSKHVD